MIVITVKRMDGFASSVCAPDETAAGVQWSALIDKACRCAEERRLAVDLVMWEVEAGDEAAATAAAEAERGRKLKSVRVRPPKQLLHKVTTNGPGAVTEAVLAKGQGAIDAKADDYPVEARADLLTLQQLTDLLGKPELTDTQWGAVMERIYKLTYKMKGQGGTFGYPMITAIAHHLYVMSRAVKTSREKIHEAIQVHIDAMHLILNRRLKGTTPEGQEIVQGLNAVVVKIVGVQED